MGNVGVSPQSPGVKRPAGRERPTLAPRTSDAVSQYLTEIRASPLLGALEERRLARRVRKGCDRARERMIVSNLRLVVSIARKFLNRGLPLADLIEEGNLGLMHAVEKFDPERGFRFSTYASWWIRQAIERAIMNQSRTVRLPVHVQKEISRCRRARAVLERDGAGSSAEAVGHLSELPEERVRWLDYVADSNGTITQASLAEDASILDLVAAATSTCPDAIAHEQNVSEILDGWLHELSERQQFVLDRRFGLHRCEPETLESIARSLGVTRERVRQIQLDALKILKHIAKRHALDWSGFAPSDG